MKTLLHNSLCKIHESRLLINNLVYDSSWHGATIIWDEKYALGILSYRSNRNILENIFPYDDRKLNSYGYLSWDWKEWK